MPSCALSRKRRGASSAEPNEQGTRTGSRKPGTFPAPCFLFLFPVFLPAIGASVSPSVLVELARIGQTPTLKRQCPRTGPPHLRPSLDALQGAPYRRSPLEERGPPWSTTTGCSAAGIPRSR